jgi:uroporphyrinogen decarboxylase
MELCTNPRLAAEVALGTIEDFDFDLAILFSDLLFPLEGLGFGLQYTDSGPQLEKDISFTKTLGSSDVSKAVEFMGFQSKALRWTRELLPAKKSLIGFVGGPWTLFVYASEGSHAGGLKKAKSDFHQYKNFYHILKAVLLENIQLQLAAGAEVVMVLDTAAGEVSPAFFQQELEPALIEMAEKFPNRLGYYSKTTYPHFMSKSMRSSAWAGFGFDHRVALAESFGVLNAGFIQGNFDQNLMFLAKDDFKTELNRFLQPFTQMSPEQRAGWICGLGHGVLPKTPEENVKRFVETVREKFA